MPIERALLNRLKSQMANAQLLLFTGAGFSLDAKNHAGSPIPSVPQLREELWRICYPADPLDPQATLGDLYAVALRRNQPALRRLIETRLAVDPQSLPDYYRVYFNLPWYRYYTLNVDDLDAAAARRWSLRRQPLPISALHSRAEAAWPPYQRLPQLEVVHLNGLLSDPPGDITFSDTQYAERVANQEPWYARCAADLRARPVVFIGTELREVPLWQHIELRRRADGSAQTMSPGSILVTPTLGAARVEMLRSLKVDWHAGTAGSFATDVLAQLSAEGQRGYVFLQAYGEARYPGAAPWVIQLGAERPSLETEYLMGEEPQWADLISGRAIGRSHDKDIMESATAILEGRLANTAIALTGTAASGKSTALMAAGLRLANQGIPVLWVDRDTAVSLLELRRQIMDTEGPVALGIDDADLFGSQLTGMLRDLVPSRPSLLFMFAMRSPKFEVVRDAVKRSGNVSLAEHGMSPLTDPDIDDLIGVLDRHNRLGVLKGVSAEQRRRAFRAKAGRQLLVAMIEATSGERFEDKVDSELDELTGAQRFVYSLICFVSAQRHYLTRDEVLLACGGIKGDPIEALERLAGSHLIVAPPPHHGYRARHRIIADLVLTRLQERRELKDVVVGASFAAAAKVDWRDARNSRAWRLLIRLINHEVLLGMLSVMECRDVYREVESLLSADYHFWLQRGSLEVERGDLRSAEQFLDQARSLGGEDYRVAVEYGYMLMRKAVERCGEPRAEEWMTRGMEELEGVIRSRDDVSFHPFHVFGAQGLAWARRRGLSSMEKRRLLSYCLNVVKAGEKKHPFRRDLAQLRTDLEGEILLTTVADD